MSSAWAQQAGGLPAGMEGIAQFVPLILIFAVFYFLLIRPQQKKMKAHRELMSQLSRGDRVVTNGGLVGTITKVVSDTEVQVEIADGVRVTVMRAMIASVLNKTETKTKAEASGS
jgi:preprotein translocase subunit YajC